MLSHLCSRIYALAPMLSHLCNSYLCSCTCPVLSHLLHLIARAPQRKRASASAAASAASIVMSTGEPCGRGEAPGGLVALVAKRPGLGPRDDWLRLDCVTPPLPASPAGTKGIPAGEPAGGKEEAGLWKG